jgi:poly(3-hydroxyalkanoate) synthetase
MGILAQAALLFGQLDYHFVESLDQKAQLKRTLLGRRMKETAGYCMGGIICQSCNGTGHPADAQRKHVQGEDRPKHQQSDQN